MDALGIVELLLTADTYNKNEDLDEDDLPPKIRKLVWNKGSIERPLAVDDELEGVEEVEKLPFISKDENGELEITVLDLAEKWFKERVDKDQILKNPTLALRFEEDFDVDYEEALASNPPKQTDAEWVHSLVEDLLGEEEMELVDVFAPEEVEQPLDEIVLTDEQEREVKKTAKAIEHREYLGKVGLRDVGKLLFVGPPGTGKTSTAKALSDRLDLPFIEVKLSMITSQYLGETAKNVEKVFELAKKISPCILFIDELDYIAKTRESDEHAALKRAVNTLLKSVDNISLVKDSVLLIGATNHPKLLDHAAWRRFDEIIEFPAPDEQMRAEIFIIITRNVEIENFDPEELARKTEGLTGSDIRMVLREAVLEALTEGRTKLNQQDLLDAIQGFEKRENLKEMDAMEDSPVAK